MSIGHIVAGKFEREKRARYKLTRPNILDARKPCQRLFGRGQEIVKLLPLVAVAKTDNHATRSNHMAVAVP